MTAQAQQTNYWSIKMKEGFINIGAYMSMFAPLSYAFAATSDNSEMLHEAGVPLAELRLWGYIMLVLLIAAVAILIMIGVSIRCCLNKNEHICTTWTLKLLRIKIVWMHHPYRRPGLTAGEYEPDYDRFVPEPYISAVISGAVWFLTALALTFPGLMPGDTVLGLDSIEIALVFCPVGVAMFGLAYYCDEDRMR